MRGRRKTRSVLIAAGSLWLLAVGTGLALLWSYENSPGTGAAPPAGWPSDSGIQRVAGLPTLVMLAHPHCPCTRASIGELDSLMAHCEGRLAAYVLFLKPEDVPGGWEKSDLWYKAASIPGVTVMADEAGIEALRFHAATSSHTLLYDSEGRLLFSGGITGSRGHSGDNAGRGAIESLVNRSLSGRAETLVFGCTLLDTTWGMGETSDATR